MQRTPFDIPDQIRAAADRGIDQAKKTMEQFMDATHQAVAKAEGSAKAVRDSSADLQRQAMAYVEENIAATFDYAERLVRARTVEELAAIQKEFVTRQVEAAGRQGKDLGEMAGKAAAKASEKPRK